MRYQIDNKTQSPNLILNQTSEFVIVTTYPVKLQSLQLWAEQQGIAACAYLCVHPQPIQGNTAKLRDIRAGWERVQKVIQAACPQVKRILAMVDSKCLQVMAGVNKADMAKWHGTLISAKLVQSQHSALPVHLEIVPTFLFSDWGLEHKKPWITRDVQRLLRLKKPNTPLTFTKGVPEWLV